MLNATYYFIKKTSNNRELQQIASKHSSGIDFKYFMKIYKNSTKKPYSGLYYQIIHYDLGRTHYKSDYENQSNQ